MELISINVSLPIEIEHQGKTVSTGIFKKPISGPNFVCKYNLTGDKQSDLKNHGGEHKAVYAFSYDHYAYWGNLLNKSAMDFGQFGENLTISGLDESKLCIGDELKIGECILQITQPRVPCFKLGLAFENKHMPRLFIAKGATGIYFRVMQEGNIEKGNQCELVKSGRHQLSVHTLFRAFYDKQFANPKSVFETALNIAELSNEWRKKVSSRLTDT